MQKKHNIVFLFSDQHNPKFTGYEGHDFVQTPNLDTLARNGLQFTNAYTPCPLCVPARHSMISGRYCRNTGIYDNTTVPGPDLPSFAQTFSESGWKTCLVGKAHFTGPDQFHGYQERPYGDFTGIGHQTDPFRGARPELEGPGGEGDHSIGGPFKLAGPSGIPVFQSAEHIIVQEAVKWLQINRAKQDDQPFLLSIHFPKPHYPFQPPRKWFEHYLDQSKGRCPIPEKAEVRSLAPIQQWNWDQFLSYGAAQEDLDRALAGYAGNVSYMDECIGHIMDSLKHLGYLENTVIIYSSDHGEMAGAHGMWYKLLFFEESVRVPLIFWGPGIPAGEKRDAVVSLVDMFPTLCDLAGLSIPSDCDGMSLTRFFSHSAAEDDRMVFSEIAWSDDIAGCMVRTGDWKYCYYIDGSEELYNLKSDPDEVHNLAGQNGNQALKKQLRSAVMEFWQPDELQNRRNRLENCPDKNLGGVAFQYCLPDGTWADAWP